MKRALLALVAVVGFGLAASSAFAGHPHPGHGHPHARYPVQRGHYHVVPHGNHYDVIYHRGRDYYYGRPVYGYGYGYGSGYGYGYPGHCYGQPGVRVGGSNFQLRIGF